MSKLSSLIVKTGMVIVDVADLNRDLTEVSFTTGGYTGDLADLPPSMVRFSMVQNNAHSTLAGDVADLPRSVLHFALQRDSGVIDGDVADLPRGMTSWDTYYNSKAALTGNIADLPSMLNKINMQNNTNSVITGAAADLPPRLVSMYAVETQWNISGSLADFPRSLILAYLNNTLCSFTADLADLPPVMHTFSIKNVASVTLSATGLGLAPTTAAARYDLNSLGLTEAQVDAILAAFATHTNWAPTGQINLIGNNAAPSAAGLASVATLQAAGCTVTHS